MKRKQKDYVVVMAKRSRERRLLADPDFRKSIDAFFAPTANRDVANGNVATGVMVPAPHPDTEDNEA